MENGGDFQRTDLHLGHSSQVCTSRDGDERDTAAGGDRGGKDGGDYRDLSIIHTRHTPRHVLDPRHDKATSYYEYS